MNPEQTNPADCVWDDKFPEEENLSVQEVAVTEDVTKVNPLSVDNDVSAAVSASAVTDSLDAEEIRIEFDDPHNVTSALAVDANHRVLSEDEARELRALVTLPSDSNENVLAALATLTGGTDFSNAGVWAAVNLEGMTNSLCHQHLVKTQFNNERVKPTVGRHTLLDPDANWDNRPVFGQTGLVASRPTFKDVESTTLTGKRAVDRIRSLSGLGQGIRIPLWHSGFWVQIKPASELELADLYRSLSMNKVQLGRTTYGAAFSNLTALQAEIYYNFVLEHVEATSLPDISLVPKYLKLHDLYHLVWGEACAVYPNGFKYLRTIMGTEHTERKVIEATLALPKIQWTNTKRLTEEQKQHMAKRGDGKMKVEEVEAYQESLKAIASKEVVVTGSNGRQHVFTLKVPDMVDYIMSGNLWVNGIVEMVDRALGVEANEMQRANVIQLYASATELRTYGHYISAVEIREADHSLAGTEDREALDQLISDFSADKALLSALVRGIREYIDESQISIIAVPALREEEDLETLGFKLLVPIDTFGTFFDLLMRRIQSIQLSEAG